MLEHMLQVMVYSFDQIDFFQGPVSRRIHI